MPVRITVGFFEREGARFYRQYMERMQLERIKDLIDELREMRQGTSPDLYRQYSGAISSLRHILRMHGIDYEPN